MKKYVSVFSLIAKNSLFRILGLLLLLVAADGALAWYRICVQGYDLSNLFRNGNGGFGIVLAVIFALIAVVQSRRDDMYSGPQGYTMRRLAISEKAVAALQILYNLLCWLLLWGVQVLAVFVICRACCRYEAGGALANQQIFLQFYISPLLHSLLPMEETLAWVANAVMIAELSVASACWAVFRREKKGIGNMLVVYWAVILFFRRELGSFFWNVLIIAGFSILLVMDCYQLFWRKKEGEDYA